ncbi:MAG: ABC-type transport auxiliary lipoprotein family protein [Pseudomonadota bacterium]
MRSRSFIAALGALALTGCISLGGGDPPEQLLTLTASAMAPAGAVQNGTMSNALAVTEPSVPQQLNVPRVPVRVNGTSLAYLKDAVWVERPARLFQNVLSETIRARGTRLVVGGGELDYAAQTQLGGELAAMDYDATAQAVVVRYDAVLRMPGGEIRTRRFENRVTGVLPDALSVAPALNQAANAVAAEVADWVG